MPQAIQNHNVNIGGGVTSVPPFVPHLSGVNNGTAKRNIKATLLTRPRLFQYLTYVATKPDTDQIKDLTEVKQEVQNAASKIERL